MSLVTEIEEAAGKAKTLNSPTAETWAALLLTGLPWWPRIREALLAAEEMADCGSDSFYVAAANGTRKESETAKEGRTAMQRFRAAYEGK